MNIAIDRLSNLTKVVYRLVVYPNERKKQVREFSIKSRQNKLLTGLFEKNSKNLVIFLVPGADWATGKDKISGGILSIVSICEETETLRDIHHSETLLCTIRGQHLLLKHETFANKTPVFRFGQVPGYFTHAENVLIHIPEFLVETFLSSLQTLDNRWLKQCKNIHFNIMNQNISLMPVPEVINRLKNLSSKITITTAHQKYCNDSIRRHYGVPIHKLSVWISPEKYGFKKWSEKKNLMVISPDAHPEREKVINHLSRIEGLELRVIQNLTYEQYKDLIATAKWSLTFGEGLDGYFIEPVFSGAISFAVYNEEFFTPDFRELTTVYDSFDSMVEDIAKRIQVLDTDDNFTRYNLEQFELCAKYYSHESYRKNIEQFYRGIYTYP